MTYVIYFLFSGVCAVLLTPLVKRFAIWLGCVDMPGLARKIHSKPMPFMGGLAVFLALLFGMCVYAGFGAWDFAIVPAKFAFGIAAGGLVLMVGGFFR
jgi:UDP-GlcNAc:undecaprenyl-phosphate GlcNAc-1-phosphate transferase